jgi:hypothetical protein
MEKARPSSHCASRRRRRRSVRGLPSLKRRLFQRDRAVPYSKEPTTKNSARRWGELQGRPLVRYLAGRDIPLSPLARDRARLCLLRLRAHEASAPAPQKAIFCDPHHRRLLNALSTCRPAAAPFPTPRKNAVALTAPVSNVSRGFFSLAFRRRDRVIPRHNCSDEGTILWLALSQASLSWLDRNKVSPAGVSVLERPPLPPPGTNGGGRRESPGAQMTKKAARGSLTKKKWRSSGWHHASVSVLA